MAETGEKWLRTTVYLLKMNRFLKKVEVVRKCSPLKGISFDLSLNMRAKIPKALSKE